MRARGRKGFFRLVSLGSTAQNGSARGEERTKTRSPMMSLKSLGNQLGFDMVVVLGCSRKWGLETRCVKIRVFFVRGAPKMAVNTFLKPIKL